MLPLLFYEWDTFEILNNNNCVIEANERQEPGLGHRTLIVALTDKL